MSERDEIRERKAEQLKQRLNDGAEGTTDGDGPSGRNEPVHVTGGDQPRC